MFNICESAFSTFEGLKGHKRIHANKKPFKCDNCEAAFNISRNLKRHKRTHTGEKPYKCDICEPAVTNII